MRASPAVVILVMAAVIWPVIETECGREFPSVSDVTTFVESLEPGSHEGPRSRNGTHGGTWYDGLDDDDEISWMKNTRLQAGGVSLNTTSLRRAVRVSNPGGVLTDFQVEVTLTVNNFDYSKVRTDGRDLRFFDESGRSLPYWKERWNTGGQSVLWVRASSLPTGNSVIWMEYGDGKVHGDSDGAATFQFFDGFSTLDGSRWTATGNHSVGGGMLSVTNGAVQTDDTVASQSGYITEVRMKWNNFVTYSGLCIADVQATQGNNWGRNKVVYLLCNHGGTRGVTAWAGSGTAARYDIVSGNNQFTATAGTWYTIGHAVEGSKVVFFKDRTPTNSYQGTWRDPYYVWLGYFTGSTAGNVDISDITADWILVRKHAPLAPLVTLGPEQSAESMVISRAITLPEGMSWDRVSIDKAEPWGTALHLSVLNASTNDTLEAFDNLTETVIDAGELNRMGVREIRLRADIVGTDVSSPLLQGWSAEWIAEDTWRDGLMTGDRVATQGGQVRDGAFTVAYNDGSADVNTSALWKMEGGGSVLIDGGPEGMNGTIVGAERVEGLMGRGLYFDGVDDYVELTEGDANLPFHDEIIENTVELWFSAENLSGRRIIYEEGGSVNGISLYILDGRLYAGAWSDSLGYAGNWTSVPVTEGWHHCAFTYSATERVSRLYLDGDLVNETSNGGRITAHVGASAVGAMRGGAKHENGIDNDNGPLHYFHGTMDELTIYDRVLAAREIGEHARVFADPCFITSEIITIDRRTDWGCARFLREVPEGTYLNVSLRDAATGEILFIDHGNLSEIAWDMGMVNPLIHRSVYFTATLVPTSAVAPLLLEWSVNRSSATHPLLLMPLTDVKVTEETPENVVLDLSGHFLDGYAPMRPPVYSLEFVSDTENITLELAGTVVNVTRLAENYTGNVSVRVNCTNLHGLVVSSNTFRIITTNVDDAPIWLSTPPPVEVEEDGKATTDYSLYDHVFDVENDTIRFSAQATDGMEVEVTETGNLRLTPPKDYYGNGIISITARELTGDGLSIGITIPFNIIAVNDPPVAVGANSTLNMPEDGVRYVNISGLFSDVDDAELMNVAVSENPRVDAAVLPNSSLRLTPERDWSGVTIVNLWAVDPSGDTGTARITLFVEEVNDPPECSIIVRTSGVGPGYGSSRIEGTGSDVDGSIAEYLWTSSLDGVLGDAPALNLSSLPLTAGTHLINFSVMDDDGAWSPVKSMLVDVGRPLVEVNRFSIPGMAAEGDEVILGMTLKNAGNAEARDLKVRFVVNGELLDEAEIGYLFPGEEVNVEIPWTPSPGEHSIEAEVEAPDGTSIVVLGDIVLAGSLTVEDDTSYAYPLLSIAATLAVIIAMLVLGRAIRRRRRRQALNELGTIIRDAGKRGVAVGDCRDIHKGLKKRFY